VSSEVLEKIMELLAPYPHREPTRERLFVVKFPVVQGSQYLLFTEKLEDLSTAAALDDGRWRLVFGVRSPMPDGRTLVHPQRLEDSDWDALARTAEVGGCDDDAGQHLAANCVGARFPLGGGREVLLVTDVKGDVARLFVRASKSRTPQCVYEI
jgi:hypothetical protein